MSQGAAAWGTARHPVWVLCFQLEVIEGQGRVGRRSTAHPAGQESANLHGKHITGFRKEALVLGQISALTQAT